ncbi:uncharacterized protein PRCAT00005860001 [Priceomyces carsonii]|uniref:uncharacterized protein n=1 Tax=Priceomyces carsonii TaxID=28549 RepID=UPI002EDA1C2C|nr:unnamed protein product [Priceomyces carsonii]
MSYTKLKSYSAIAIESLLPIDRDTSRQIVDSALVLPSDHDVQANFLNLLGESEDSLTFIRNFLKLKHEADSEEKKRVSTESTKNKKTLPDDITTSSKNKSAWSTPGEFPPRKEIKKTSADHASLRTLNSKSSNRSELGVGKKSKKSSIENLKDIEDVLNELEVVNSKTDGLSAGLKRSCNCMATRHPLFEVAPNCLNCGKIICAKEGLQPCSYCGHELLSKKDKQEIISILENEKSGIMSKPDKSVASTQLPPKQKNKKVTVSMTAGENLWKAQDRALRKVEEDKKRDMALLEQSKREQEELATQKKELQRYERSNYDPDLLKAQENLDTLLHFQATGSERTKVIDNVSDYDSPNSGSGSIWLSPMERALQLKKQQKQYRKDQDSKSKLTGRSQRALEMVIKDGKVTMVETHVPQPDSMEDDKEIKDLEDTIRTEREQGESANSRNIWDYETDSKKWQKPTFISTNKDSLNGVQENQQCQSRVQFEGKGDIDELLIAMP